MVCRVGAGSSRGGIAVIVTLKKGLVGDSVRLLETFDEDETNLVKILDKRHGHLFGEPVSGYHVT